MPTRAVLLLLLSLALAVPAGATDYYVATGGPASNCTQAQNINTPLSTIVAGIHCLDGGDTLFIRGGTYPESWTVQEQGPIAAGTAGSPTTIKAYAGEEVLWTPVSPDCAWVDGVGAPLCATVLWIGFTEERFIQFEDLHFDGVDRVLKRGLGEIQYPYSFPVSSERPNGKAILSDHPSDITFKNCEWTNFEGEFGLSGRRLTFSGGKVHHIGSNNGLRHFFYPSVTEDLLIENMELYDNINGYVLHSFLFEGAIDTFNRTVVRNNYIHDIGLAANGAVSGAGQDGILLAFSADALVYNNVFENIGGAAVDIGHIGPATNIRIFHNTFVSTCIDYCPGGVIYITYNSNHFCQNNIFWQNGNRDVYGPYGDTCDYAGNLSGPNPLFVSQATHDYHLTEASPARGSGVSGTGITTDKDGNPYPSPPDAGAYAYGTVFSPTPGTFYVATTGSDGNDCEAAQNAGTPLATFAKAFACAAGGSTIRVRGGTYTQNISTTVSPIAAGTLSAPTTVMSAPGETAILQPSSPGPIIDVSGVATDRYLVFERLVLDGVNAPNSSGLQVMPGAQHIRFHQGEIKNIVNNAVYLGGATTEILSSQLHTNTTAGALIVALGADNIIRGNTIFSGVSAGVFLAGATNTLVEGNTIRNNANRGLRGGTGSNTQAFNNLIYSNGGDGIVVESGQSGMVLYHNTVWNNSALGLNILAGASSTAYTNNLFYQNGTDLPSNAGTGTIGTTNVSGSPSFLAPGPPATFHVQGANVVHQGTPLAAVTTDIAGKGRSNPPGYTIGAYQDDVVGSGPGPEPGPQLAFPTAEGFGRFAVGGRGGKAYHINSLSASDGSGGSCNAGGCRGGTITFPDCIHDRFGVGPRTCIFRVGGTIDWPCTNCTGAWPPYITIAGQTAPGDGIMIKHMQLEARETHDVIVRHLRVRNGTDVPEPGNAGALETLGSEGSTYNVIFDHCSAGWSPDDTISGIGSTAVTYQWTIFSEGLGDAESGPSKVGVWSGGSSDASESFLYNLSAHFNFRAPPVNTAGWQQVVNNVFYNIESNGGPYPYAQNGGLTTSTEYVANYFLTGPNTQAVGEGDGCMITSCGYLCNELMTNLDNVVNSRIYLSGNYHNIRRPDNTYPETAVIVSYGDPIIPIVTTPLGFPALPSQMNAQQARTAVLAKAGARVPLLDTIDQRILAEVNNGTGGIIHHENDVGGFPTYASGTPYPDTDGDGIRDEWETAHGLDPNDAADGPALATNGYSNLENFLNELAGDAVPLGTPPAVDLIASPTNITTGGSSTLSWTSAGVTSCSAPWTTSTAPSGSQSVSPTATTTYTITCTDGTTSVEDSAAVLVAGAPAVSLTATPQSIFVGDTSTLSWTSTDVTSCSAPWTTSTATSGSQSVSPTVTTTYTVTCTNGTTPVTSDATVTVTPRPGPGVRGLPYASSGFFVMP